MVVLISGFVMLDKTSSMRKAVFPFFRGLPQTPTTFIGTPGGIRLKLLPLTGIIQSVVMVSEVYITRTYPQRL